MVSFRTLLEVSSPTSLSATSFSPDLFVILQEILYQPSFTLIRLFAKDKEFSK